MLKKFIRSKFGSAPIEYALIAGIIAAAMVSGIADVEDDSQKMYSEPSYHFEEIR
ncbi:MAG: hypothetical protein AAF217_11090 [Pseudomonadota bacterium]